MFFGQWPRIIDKKNRLTIPSRFIKEFNNGEVLIYSNGEKEKVSLYTLEKAEALPVSEKRFFMPASIDEQGRVIIPRQIASSILGGSKAVILEGWGDYLKVVLSK